MWEESGNITQRIKKLRELDHRSIEDCASFIGITAEKFRQIEENECGITLPELELLALLFKMPIDVFFDNSLFEETVLSFYPAPNNRDYKRIRNRVILSLIEMERMKQHFSRDELVEMTNTSHEIFNAFGEGLPLNSLEQICNELMIVAETIFEGGLNPYQAIENEIEEEHWEPEYPEKPPTVAQEFNKGEENYDKLVEAIKRAPKEEQALMAQILLRQLKEN
jgi:transcriptional regulator with XRE-family HTH domain